MLKNDPRFREIWKAMHIKSENQGEYAEKVCPAIWGAFSRLDPEALKDLFIGYPDKEPEKGDSPVLGEVLLLLEFLYFVDLDSHVFIPDEVE